MVAIEADAIAAADRLRGYCTDEDQRKQVSQNGDLALSNRINVEMV